MKIIGKTLEGDLIIQVSQAEWSELQKGKSPPADSSLAIDILIKESRELKRGGSIAVRKAINYIIRHNSIDGWLFDDFISELYRPDSAVGGTYGIGPKFLNILREHFSRHQLAPKDDQ